MKPAEAILCIYVLRQHSHYVSEPDLPPSPFGADISTRQDGALPQLWDEYQGASKHDLGFGGERRGEGPLEQVKFGERMGCEQRWVEGCAEPVGGPGSGGRAWFATNSGEIDRTSLAKRGGDAVR